MGAGSTFTSLAEDPPAAVLVEAQDEVDAGRAALVRLRACPPLAEVPILAAVSVAALQRIQPADAFDDLVLVPYVPVEFTCACGGPSGAAATSRRRSASRSVT
ncbi:MAG: hypothetical protein M5U28_38335 [Sandaracinaceae bacterium]|nr:hypothetical protein [Sandaracinaceae bacterium]